MSKKKLYFVLFIFFISAILTKTQTIKAHSPESMIVSYSGGVLEVIISHEVTDPSSHYISSVEIEINGTTVLTESYTSQPDANWFPYHYNITAGTNDRIKITVRCNEGGSSSICILGGGGSCPQEEGNGIPGYLGLWIIIGISGVALLTIIRKNLRKNTT